MTKQGIKIFLCVCVGLVLLAFVAPYNKLIKPTIDEWREGEWKGLSR